MLVTWGDRMLDCDVFVLWHFSNVLLYIILIADGLINKDYQYYVYSACSCEGNVVV